MRPANLIAATSTAGLVWALSLLWPSLVYPETPGTLPECNVTLPETQVRATEVRT